MNDHLDEGLRDRLFLARINREVGHRRVLREHAVTERLHRDLHAVVAETQRLRRRARWLRLTKRPLPKTVQR